MSQAVDAYRQLDQAAGDARTEERRIIRRVTTALENAYQGCEDKVSPDLAAALHDNRSLWRQFAIDVADENNQLSQEDRAGVMSIASFVENRTSDILAREISVSQGIPILLVINQNIIKGLENNPA